MRTFQPITIAEQRPARGAAVEGIARMIDTRCPWTVPEAIELLLALASHDSHWIEELVWPQIPT